MSENDSVPVDIVMATYRGEPYLKAQIESLQKQTHSNWTLWIRDDGSEDGTEQLTRKLAAEDSRIRPLPTRRAGPSGPTANFNILLESLSQPAPYVFFCDQDDVWIPEKLSLQIRALQEAERRLGAQAPIAVHSDLKLVGPKLEQLHSSAKQHMGFQPESSRPFQRLLAQNFVTGCTLGINRALLKASLPIPSEALMHDWWIALVAAAVGEIVYLPQATVLYRQHGANASGPSRPKGLWEGAQAFLAKEAEFQELMRKRFRQSRKLEEHLSRFSTNSSLEWLKKFHSSLKKSRIQGVCHAVTGGIAMQGWARTGAYYLLLLKGGFPPEP